MYEPLQADIVAAEASLEFYEFRAPGKIVTYHEILAAFEEAQRMMPFPECPPEDHFQWKADGWLLVKEGYRTVEGQGESQYFKAWAQVENGEVVTLDVYDQEGKEMGFYCPRAPHLR